MTPLEKAKELRKQIETLAQELTDEKAIEMIDLHPAWSGDGIFYKAGARIRYDGKLYVILQSHTSQPAWTPEAAASLFAKVLAESGKILPWQQPDSTNPYGKGDRVLHENQTWESTVDGNVWAPGVYGWIAIE